MQKKVKKSFLILNTFQNKDSSKGIVFIPLIIGIIAAGGVGALLTKLGVTGMAADLAKAIIAALAAVLGGVGMMFLGYCQDLLNWVIGPNFIGVSMTGMDNPIIAAGWTRMRDLANIFLILATIIIALGIILGFEEYRAKKTLPTLIIIALLINFTPVICGFIIDFSNTLMKWVLGVGSIHPGFIDTVTTGYNNIEAKDSLESLLLSLSYILFGFVGGIIYLLYALVFILRYIFLWILVAFSPIAFASRVFGSSTRIRKFFPSFLYWDQWWNDFLTWNVIGIFGAFFIFLANALMNAMVLGQNLTSTPTGDLAAFGALFIYLLPILLLLIGFFSTISMTQEAMTATVPGMQQSLATMAKGAAKSARYAGKKAGEAIPESARRWGERQARALPPKGTASWGKGEAGVPGWLKRRAGQLGTAATSPYWLAQRGIGRILSAPAEGQMDDINKARNEFAGKSAEIQGRGVMTAGIKGDEIGRLEAMIEDNNTDDFRLTLTEEGKKEFDEKVKGIMAEAAGTSRGSFNRIARAFPQHVDEVARKKLNKEMRAKMGLGEEEDLKKQGLVNKDGNASFARRVIQGMQPGHVSHTTREALVTSDDDSPEQKVIKEAIQEEIYTSWENLHHIEAIKIHKKKYVDNYIEGAEKRGAMDLLFKNPANFTQLSTPYIAAESGMFPPEEMTYEEAAALSREYSKFTPEEKKEIQTANSELPIGTRRDLTQCLRINPKRMEELKGKSAADIKGKTEEWMAAAAARKAG